MQYQKVKSVSKAMLSKGSTLTQVVLETAKSCSDLVGATLGPGGMPVLIERQELNLPAMVTKDGVTVFRALGYDSSIKHVIMETMRDASIRTASEAGDGTTTAIVWPGDIAHETEAPLVVTNDNPATNGNPSGGDSTALDQPGGAANAEEGSTSDDADASGRPELTEAQQKRKAEAEEKLPQNWEELDAPAMRELAKAHNVEVGPSDKRAGMIAKIKDEFHLD
jgi:hypothetical protein